MKFGQIFESDSLGQRTNAHSHSQRPVPGDFLLFKRCEWLVSNWTVSIWTSLKFSHYTLF